MALVTPTTERGRCSWPLVGRAAHVAGVDDLGSIVNPEGVTIIVTKCVVYRTTASAGAANLTIGHAASITDAHDTTDVCPSVAINGAVAGTAINGNAWGDPADAPAVVAAGEFISAYADDVSTGFAGIAYIEYLRVS